MKLIRRCWPEFFGTAVIMLPRQFRGHYNVARSYGAGRFSSLLEAWLWTRGFIVIAWKYL